MRWHRGSSKVKCYKEAQNANTQEPSQKGKLLAHLLVCSYVIYADIDTLVEDVTCLYKHNLINCVADNLFS